MNSFDPRTCERYCIFCTAEATFAISTLSVREIAESPVLVAVPNAPSALAGLCHFRNEFLPVFSLGPLVEEFPADADNGKSLLVLSRPEGDWAVSIDRALAVESLETALSENGAATPAAIMGTASFRDDIVKVLDADALYHRTVSILADAWHCEDRRIGTNSVELNTDLTLTC